MKTEVIIGSLFNDHLGPELYTELERICSDAIVKRFPGSMEISLPITDVRSHQILDRLASAGFHPRSRVGYSNFKSTYSLILNRQYDSSDYEAAPYLELSPPVYIGGVGVPEEQAEAIPWSADRHGERGQQLGPIPLQAKNLSADVDFAHSRELWDHGGWVVVPDRVRRLIESAGLVGPVFRPTVLVDSVEPQGQVIPWEQFGEPWWELLSSLTLPPVSPTMDLYDGRSNRILRGQTEVGAVRVEGHYWPVELHYQSSEMAQMPPFDLAHTREAFFARRAWTFPEDRALVASKRFYRFCLEYNLKTNWVPVRIEPS